MSTKIVAARLATSAGVTTIITRSSTPGNLVQILAHVTAAPQPQLQPQPEPEPEPEKPEGGGVQTPPPSALKVPLHTRFLPWPEPIRDRSFWILHGLKPHGTVYIDQGACQALLDHAGLLPVGVVDVDGPFAEDDAVRLVVVDRKVPAPASFAAAAAAAGIEVGRALVKYSSTEIARIRGHRSADISGILGYVTSEYVAQREHISMFRTKDSRPASPAPHTAPRHKDVSGTVSPLAESLALSGVANSESKA